MVIDVPPYPLFKYSLSVLHELARFVGKKVLENGTYSASQFLETMMKYNASGYCAILFQVLEHNNITICSLQ
jgi:hypothetical protein